MNHTTKPDDLSQPSSERTGPFLFSLLFSGSGRPISVITSSRYLACTGCMNPGTRTTGHPPKYWASRRVSPVALIRTTRSSGFSFRTESSRARSRSVLTSLSWTSSTTTWLMPWRPGLDCSFRRRTPTVRKSRAPPLRSGGRDSRRTWKSQRHTFKSQENAAFQGQVTFYIPNMWWADKIIFSKAELS